MNLYKYPIFLPILLLCNVTFSYNEQKNNANPILITLNSTHKIYEPCGVNINVHPGYLSKPSNIPPIIAAALINNLTTDCSSLICPTALANSFSSPRAIAITPNGKYAYITNSGNDSVSIIDLQTNQIACSSILVGDNPLSMAITPNGAKIYVANENSDTASIISTTSNTVTSSITALQTPVATVITPDGQYVIFIGDTGGTRQYFTATNTLFNIRGTSSSSANAAISPNGLDWYIVNNKATNNVQIWPVAGGAASSIVTRGTFHTAIAITPDGLYAYITNNQSSSVIVLNTGSLTTVTTISVGTNPFDIAITPNGQYAYVTNNGSNTVSVIKTSDNSVIATIPVGTSPYKIAIHPDGGYAYVTNNGNNTVSVISTATNTVTTTIS